MSLSTRSHIIGPRNEMDSMPCMKEFALRICNVSFRRKLYGCETDTSTSFKMSQKTWKTLQISIASFCT